MASLREQAWALFDRITADASAAGYNSPWQKGTGSEPLYVPDYGTLQKLLGVPVLLAADSRSGVPALALDVWMAYELRRCGFDPDAVWPRAEAPRVLPTEISKMLRDLPKVLRVQLADRIAKGKGKGLGAASAKILGKNYVKQVDVVISSWETGPELLISTKRMDSSFGKNAPNRIEESYGDAKNLRLRYPQAGHGFFYGLSANAFTQEPATAAWLLDLLIKMGQEEDAYDAVGLIIPEASWAVGGSDTTQDVEQAPSEMDVAGEADEDFAVPNVPDDVVNKLLTKLPIVTLQLDRVPDELDPARFLGLLVTKVLRNSPIDFHTKARNRRQEALSDTTPLLNRGL